MNRKERRTLLKQQHALVADLPDQLIPVPEEELVRLTTGERPRLAWRSRKYMVQAFVEENAIRLSICHSRLGGDGHWEDGFSWDELQSIKKQVGFGDFYGVEVYPREVDLVNVANMRHLWIFAQPLPIGWFKK